MAANPTDLPDLEESAQASQTVTHNFRRISNPPAVEGGAAIIEGLQQQIQQQMQQQLSDMEQRLAIRISACNTNSISRVFNAKIHTPDHPLEPLRHVVNNTAIDGFPTTPAAVSRLPPANVNDLLTALGEDFEGNPEVKRQRFCRVIGLNELFM